MQCYSIPVPSLNTAQQYAETAGSLAEALHNLFLRRPMPITNQSNPGAQAAYYRAVGAWYMENNDIIAAALMACRLLSDGAALELENVREAAESPAEPPSVGGNGPNAAGYTSSLPDTQGRENAARSAAPAGTGANPQAPGGVLFYRQALVNQQPKPTRKQKGRAATSAGECPTMNRHPAAPHPAPSEEAAALALTATFRRLNEEGQHKILTYAVDLAATGVYAKNVVRFSWLKAKGK